MKKRIGYFLGSFDPVHKGHQFVVETVLKRNLVDKVLMYPAPGDDRFKERTPWHLRQEMLESLYRENPRVILSRLYPNELHKQYSHDAMIGIIGSDLVLDRLLSQDANLQEEYHTQFMRGLPLTSDEALGTMGAIKAFHVDAFIVALRNDRDDLTRLHGYIRDRKILATIKSIPVSSSEVRKGRFDQVDPRVLEVILREHLYKS